MLRFESVFWTTKDKTATAKKLESLGLNVTPSKRDPHTLSVYFGPEALEIFGSNDSLSTLTDKSSGDGVVGIGLESDNISDDFRRLQLKGKDVEKPRQARDTANDIPLWMGFNIPPNFTPGVNAWVVMNSPAVLKIQSEQNLPLTHKNTCFGIEAVHLLSKDSETTALQWGKLVDKHVSGLQWNEIDRSAGKRLQIGERFFDVITAKPKLSQGVRGDDGVFMVTLKVSDLEGARAMAQKAGANPTPCSSRDGFYVSHEFTGGPALRFVRAYWKRYLPVINENYPLGRRTDTFRPLGGTDSTTLRDGFEDNWKY